LPVLNVVHCDGTEQDAVIEKQNNRAKAPPDSQRHRAEGDLRVVHHELTGKGGFVSLKTVLLCGLLPGNPVGRRDLKMGKGHQHLLRAGIETEGKPSEEGSSQSEKAGEVKGSQLPSKSLGKRSRQPGPGLPWQAATLSTVHLRIGAGHELFQMPAQDRLRRERGKARQVGCGALIEHLQFTQFSEAELAPGVLLNGGEYLLEPLPTGALAHDELFPVEDHGRSRLRGAAAPSRGGSG